MLESNYNTLLSIKPCWELSRPTVHTRTDQRGFACDMRFYMRKNKKHKTNECKHPPEQLYAWYAADGTLCIGCCNCGKALKGAA